MSYPLPPSDASCLSAFSDPSEAGTKKSSHKMKVSFGDDETRSFCRTDKPVAMSEEPSTYRVEAAAMRREVDACLRERLIDPDCLDDLIGLSPDDDDMFTPQYYSGVLSYVESRFPRKRSETS